MEDMRRAEVQLRTKPSDGEKAIAEKETAERERAEKRRIKKAEEEKIDFTTTEQHQFFILLLDELCSQLRWCIALLSRERKGKCGGKWRTFIASSNTTWWRYHLRLQVELKKRKVDVQEKEQVLDIIKCDNCEGSARYRQLLASYSFGNWLIRRWQTITMSCQRRSNRVYSLFEGIATHLATHRGRNRIGKGNSLSLMTTESPLKTNEF